LPSGKKRGDGWGVMGIQATMEKSKKKKIVFLQERHETKKKRCKKEK